MSDNTKTSSPRETEQAARETFEAGAVFAGKTFAGAWAAACEACKQANVQKTGNSLAATTMRLATALVDMLRFVWAVERGALERTDKSSSEKRLAARQVARAAEAGLVNAIEATATGSDTADGSDVVRDYIETYYHLAGGPPNRDDGLHSGDAQENGE